MSLAVAPIVEGHGEVASARLLLDRIVAHIDGSEFVDVMRPFRVPRGRMVQEKEIRRATQFVADKLLDREADHRLILILFDADEDCAGKLGPEVLAMAREARADIDIFCAIACVEYETWFIASAASLEEYLEAGDRDWPASPETDHQGKAWIRRHMRIGRYSETVDQPKLTAKIDVELCASRSPSFARLVRAMRSRLAP